MMKALTGSLVHKPTEVEAAFDRGGSCLSAVAYSEIGFRRGCALDVRDNDFGASGRAWCKAEVG